MPKNLTLKSVGESANFRINADQQVQDALMGVISRPLFRYEEGKPEHRLVKQADKLKKIATTYDKLSNPLHGPRNIELNKQKILASLA